MNNKDKAPLINKQLAALQLAFYEGLPKRLSTLKTLSSELQNGDQTENLKTLSDLHLHTHSLAGSAGIYNAREIADAAKELESTLFSLKSQTEPLASIQDIETQTQILEAAIKEWQPSTPVPVESNQPQDDHFIYLNADSDAATLVSDVELGDAGFIIKRFTCLEDIQQACLKETPSVIIVETNFSEHDNELLTKIKQRQNQHTGKPSIFCLTDHGDPRTRLIAAKIGISKLFTKPFNKYKLIKTVKKTIEQYNPELFRVLIIDDETESRQYHTAILKKSGILAKSIENPLDFVDAIDKFKPELILLDVYIPNCSGLEVATMIRQDNQYTDIPIIFLSSEGNMTQQLAAINIGADDFITKPVDPDYLIATITGRLHRIRKLHRLNTMLKNTLLENEHIQFALDQHAIVSTTDATGTITYANDKFCNISGYDESELLSSKHNIVKSGFHPKSFYEELWATITNGKVWRGEICNRRKDGRHYWVSSTIVPFVDSTGSPYQYTSIRTDISEQKIHEQELLKAKTAAEEANQAKSKFLANMSHELRTPMNAILGFAQLLEADGIVALSECQLDNVHEILKAGNHLLELINEVLDLSRIEAGRVNLELSVVQAHAVIQECVDLMQPLLDKYDVKLDYCPADEPEVYIRADRFRVKQVLLNLISNAIKYNRPGGRVFITCQTDHDQGVIEIQDTGIGIPDERMDELFHPFSRLVNERSNIEGSGIGLVITKQLIELMGGQIGVKNHDTMGTTFWVQLPSEISHRLTTDDENTDQSSAGTAHEFNILYIEDNPTNLRLVTRLLARRPQIHLWTAHEPFLGIELAMEHHPNLILMDINLPGIDGYEAMQQLQNNPKTKTIPVVAITANSSSGNAEKAKQAGFTQFLTKPIDIDAFFEIIDNAVAATQESTNQ